MAFDIETLDDLITASSCCCDPVLCPVSVRECESISKPICGYYLPPNSPCVSGDDLCRSFKKQKHSYVYNYSGDWSYDGTFRTKNVYTATYTTTYELSVTAGVCSSTIVGRTTYTENNVYIEAGTYNDETEEWEWEFESDVTVYEQYSEVNGVGSGTWWQTVNSGSGEDAGPFPYTGGEDVNIDSSTIDETWTCTTTSFELFEDSTAGFAPPALLRTEKWTLDYLEEMEDALEGYVFPDDVNGNQCSASRNCNNAVKASLTYRVPHEWTDPISGATVPFPGTYFKLTYDILTTPTGWSSAPEYTGPARSYLSDQTMEWSGPGSGDADDPSWEIGTVILDPPGEPGTREIVNLRFTCRDEGMFANVPQVTGFSTDLSEDIPLTRTFDRPTGSIHLPL